MLKNYLKIALRNLVKYKTFSLINIIGLAIGMAACFLILIYVCVEFSFDRFHTNSEDIYRILLGRDYKEKQSGDSQTTAPSIRTPGPLASALKEEFPEIVHALRISNAEHPVYKHNQKIMISYKDKYFYADDVLFADPSIFDVFTLPMLVGNPKTALVAPYTMVITKDIANKYFGDEDPVGKTVIYNNQSNNYNFTITGVVQNIPYNSSLQFNFLCSMTCVDEVVGYEPPASTNWEYSAFMSYILVKKDFSYAEFQQKLSSFMEKHPGFKSSETQMNLFLQPLKQIHLFSVDTDGLIPNSTLRFLFLLSVIAVFIIIIASINYVNLATARAATRTKEVSMRKVLGAERKHLIKQFLGESVFISFIALVFAGIIIEILLPFSRSFIDKKIEIHNLDNLPILLCFFVLTLLVGIVAGSYPALFLSSFQPLDVLRKASKTGLAHFSLRKILIVFQFVISIVLIVITISIFEQIEYMRNRQLGVKKEHIVVIPLRGFWFDKKHEILKQELLQNPGIISASASSSFPGEQSGKFGLLFWWEGCGEKDEPEFKPLNHPGNMPFLGVDYDFIKNFGLELIRGRDFSKDISSDANSAYILNETAMRYIGWTDSPVGKTFHSTWAEQKPGTVIGVIEDFHFKPVREKIEPLVLFIGGVKYLSVKIQSENVQDTMKFIESCWKKLAPSRPFEFFFLDEYFDKLYKTELMSLRLFTISSILAIFIACLGLFGMVSSVTEQRTKEVGIRKVLGASESSIVFLLSKDLIKWVVIANVIAWPIVYFAMNKWLQNFAYRITIDWWMFILAGTLALAIALITVSFQSIRAALANPVESLRYE